MSNTNIPTNLHKISSGDGRASFTWNLEIKSGYRTRVFYSDSEFGNYTLDKELDSSTTFSHFASRDIVYFKLCTYRVAGGLVSDFSEVLKIDFRSKDEKNKDAYSFLGNSKEIVDGPFSIPLQDGEISTIVPDELLERKSKRLLSIDFDLDNNGVVFGDSSISVFIKAPYSDNFYLALKRDAIEGNNIAKPEFPIQIGEGSTWKIEFIINSNVDPSASIQINKILSFDYSQGTLS